MISLVLPVFNCYQEFEASLPDLIRSMKSRGYSFEIIVVDDGSGEGAGFKRLAERHDCVYIRSPRNFGKGHAVKTGFRAARGEVLVFMDGDFPFALEAIHRLICAFQDGSNEVVIGDRTLPESVYAHDIPVMRKLGSRILSFFAGNYFTPGFYDTQCGIKGFRAAVAERIFSVATVNGFSFDMEILFIALKRKHVIARVPVEARKQVSSNVRIWVHGTRMLADLIRIAWNNARGKYGS